MKKKGNYPYYLFTLFTVCLIIVTFLAGTTTLSLARASRLNTFIPIISKLTAYAPGEIPPYPPSTVISGAVWDFRTLVRKAPGSDLWSNTWAADDNIYTSFGDGPGFEGTDSGWEASLGFARIVGSPQDFTGVNVWGGYQAENPATFGGKTQGLLSVNGVLYGWINTRDEGEPEVRLGWSEDLSRTWQLADDWGFPEDSFVPFSFLNYGKDYAGAKDEYVYIYGGAWDGDIHYYLARAPKDQLRERESYEFFQGLDGNSNPIWNKDIRERQPVFSDENYVSGGHVIYNPGIGRYLLATGHHGYNQQIFGLGKLGLFDAPAPWGPWTTVAYYDDWGDYSDQEELGWHIPTKWISSDGKTLWVVFSSRDELDSFNLVRLSLILK